MNTQTPGGTSDPLYFVLCPSFHGATLFALLLNNHPDLVTLGDTNPTRAYDQICSCGLHVSECPFWQDVAEACRADRFSDCAKMLPTLPRIIKHHRLNKAINLAFATAGLKVGRRIWHLRAGSLREFVDTWDTFRRIATVRGNARLAIDGEKSIAKFLAFESANSRETRIIHLTRDPRAFVNSCRKHHEQPWRTAVADWRQTHRKILMVSKAFGPKRYLRVQYEELARRPNEVMAGVFGFIGVPHADVCDRPRYAARHHLMGNKMLREFDGRIRLDTAWRDALPADEQAAVLSAAEPLASLLDYPIT